MRKMAAIAAFAVLCLIVAACQPHKAAQAGIQEQSEEQTQTEVMGPPAPEKAAEAAGPSAPALKKDGPLIAIVIDDMGVDHKHSRSALKLPAAVTMSYLPYAEDVKAQVAKAKAAGHEVILHMPMEPLRSTADPGPDVLKGSLTKDEIRARMEKNLAAFSGYDGVNNHMGSKFTQDRDGLQVVMEELKKKGLFFLDSKTIPASVAEKVAHENGVRATHRDIFLDDEETETFTENALGATEAVARRRGSAIAIGHPKRVTLRDLKAWIPQAEKKGFRFVPLSELLKYREEHPRKKKVASLKSAADSSGGNE
jgi:polysaccharide deacetylase 2 family uncharacterized protein YibQ